jgi:hypothetical protein
MGPLAALGRHEDEVRMLPTEEQGRSLVVAEPDLDAPTSMRGLAVAARGRLLELEREASCTDPRLAAHDALPRCRRHGEHRVEIASASPRERTEREAAGEEHDEGSDRERAAERCREHERLEHHRARLGIATHLVRGRVDSARHAEGPEHDAALVRAVSDERARAVHLERPPARARDADARLDRRGARPRPLLSRDPEHRPCGQRAGERGQERERRRRSPAPRRDADDVAPQSHRVREDGHRPSRLHTFRDGRAVGQALAFTWAASFARPWAVVTGAR